ncbi:MAG: ABC transporter permease [Actinomycetota bacterium]|nr:ABC transporter permease [Actinomycetota bacterium]
MKALPYLLLIGVLVAVAVRIRHRRGMGSGTNPFAGHSIPIRGAVALVAAREVRERTRGRLFRVGTIVILLAIAAGIVIPTLQHGHDSSERVGVLGTISTPLRASIVALGPKLATNVTLVSEPGVAAARRALSAGAVDVVVEGTTQILLNTTPSAGDTSTTAQLAQALSAVISLQATLQASGLSAQQAAALTHPRPLPITGLHPAHKARTGHTVTVYGLILLFVLLSQYGTWILLGVVEEKSSRVVEVLLAAVRPRQLLAGKVLGIGIVALMQAALILAVALGVGAAVGSDLLHGGNPTDVLATLAWLVLGYVFYCWVYAAAGSLATRQEHIQTLAFPLQLPLLLGYITSLTAITSTSASTIVHVLAYLPPTAPFAMPVLVALGQVTWWQFAIAVALSVGATAGVARLAATVYVRAILRTGQRVRLRDVARSDATPRVPAS